MSKVPFTSTYHIYFFPVFLACVYICFWGRSYKMYSAHCKLHHLLCLCIYCRLGQGEVTWSVDVEPRELLPALRGADANSPSERIQRLGHAPLSPHPAHHSLLCDLPRRNQPLARRPWDSCGEFVNRSGIVSRAEELVSKHSAPTWTRERRCHLILKISLWRREAFHCQKRWAERLTS